MINFKQERFEGTLLDLFRECNAHLAASRERISQHHDWLVAQLDVASNLLPIRKGGAYRERGRTVGAGERRFLVVDNEPLASQYELVLQEQGFGAHSFEDLLRAGVVSASWKSDVANATPLHFKGVRSSFRARGLKLAHIFDAAQGLDQVSSPHEQLPLRFLRSQSLLNVFLFPNPRSARFAVKQGFVPTRTDLGEDGLVRSLALGFLLQETQLAPETCRVFRSGFEQLDVALPQDWEKTAREIVLEVHPKTAAAPVRDASRPAVALGDALKNTAGEALDPLEAVDRLRSWLADHPEAVQLDGRTVKASNPAKWLHL